MEVIEKEKQQFLAVSCDNRCINQVGKDRHNLCLYESDLLEALELTLPHWRSVCLLKCCPDPEETMYQVMFCDALTPSTFETLRIAFPPGPADNDILLMPLEYFIFEVLEYLTSHAKLHIGQIPDPSGFRRLWEQVRDNRPAP